MKALIVDDEPAARARLIRMLAKHPEVCVEAEASDGVDALEKIETVRPDLVFLDIEMPGLGGFEVVRSIPAVVPMPLFVFATGYDQHALKAFEMNALAYLLKPVEADRLAQAVERARRLSEAAEGRESERRSLMEVAERQPSEVLRRVVCRTRGRIVLVPVEQILWFQAEDGVVKAGAATESFEVNFTIGELENSLQRDMFFRARREVLVNLSKIREITPWFKSGFRLVMADAAATEIVVSERQVHLFRKLLPGL
jgi:two-component system LytT family response regulator